MSHLLSAEMKEAFMTGILSPLLGAVQADRDLIMEFRDANAASIYYKGHCIEIERCGEAYEARAHKKLFEPGTRRLGSIEEAQAFVGGALLGIKKEVAGLRCTGTEIEFEQALIRANNREPGLNTDYFAVDRQVALCKGERQRVDVLGVYWPDRRFGKELSLALIEVKFGLDGGIDKIAEQVEGYYQALASNIAAVAEDTQKLLRQKLDMGLITAVEPNALAKLKTMEVSKDPRLVKIVLALVDANPRSTLLPRQESKLAQLEEKFGLANPIDIYFLGFGLWKENAKHPRRELAAAT
jgi:hypothetical protein